MIRVTQGLLVVIAFLVSGHLVIGQERRSAETAAPNIILLLSDDQGYGDIGRHGHPYLKTPHFDRLYDESVRLTDFSVSPTCAPTRAALMTGMQEFNSGVTHTLLPRRNMNNQVTTLPQLLSDAGYKTGMFGKWHLGQQDGYRPEQRGFDVALTVPEDSQRSHYDPDLLLNGQPEKSKGYRTDIFYNRAMDWISENKEDPFFCYIPTYNAHNPTIVPEEFIAPYKGKVDDKAAEYLGMISNLDWNLGRLVDHLDNLKLAEYTLVIYMNDNGGTFGVDTYNAGMRGCKGTIWRGGTRAFSFWRWPGQLEPRDENSLTGHIDVLPTLVELAGGKLSEAVVAQIEGISLAERLRHPKTSLPDRMLFQHVSRWSTGLADQHKYVNASIRWKSWHLLRSGTVDTCEGECRVYRKAINGERMLYTENQDIHYAQTSTKQWSLFNLTNDPNESHDLTDTNPEVVDRMSVAYDRWWEKVRPSLINE
ncbi:arylsulfatase [Opitutia bacterium ISCC 51]|nr:arylsulfatase [Opitutae bacterium ISCC 51]QXD28532.1 arylsulfatase [Opitutae bacterium ISCC 52]